jgi:hypothetical protein
MYELCCDMIDLLINMSEIYGQPNGSNNVRSPIDDNDDEDDEDYINYEREHLHDDNSEPHEWNLAGQDDGYDENSVHLNGSASHSYGSSMFN